MVKIYQLNNDKNTRKGCKKRLVKGLKIFLKKKKKININLPEH